jgi:phage shock protein A
MDANELYDASLKMMERAQKIVKNALNVLEEIEDDEILSQQYIGEEMDQPNILVLARNKVKDLQREAVELLAKKEKLEKQWKAIKAQNSDSAVFATGHYTRTGRIEFDKAPPKPATELVEAMSSDVAAWLRKNAPEKLPPLVVEPTLSIEQQAKFAHNDYVDACYRLGQAKLELVALEKKVADLRELLRCV